MKAAAWHLGVSSIVAALCALLVFRLWYPGPFRLLAGGRDLFFLVTAVDVALGPLLTFVVFEPKKGWRHLQRDLAVIALVQLAALSYGLWTVHVVRPVALVFEVDRFRVVTANSVLTSELPAAPPEYRQLPLTGPWLLSVRDARRGDERNNAIFMALDGVDTSQRPIFWQRYELAKKQALEKSRPVSLLQQKYPLHEREIKHALSEAAVPSSEARFLPVLARGDWVALLNQSGRVVGFLPLDGFF